MPCYRILIIDPSVTSFELRREALRNAACMTLMDDDTKLRDQYGIAIVYEASGCVVEHATNLRQAMSHLRTAREMDARTSHYDVVSVADGRLSWLPFARFRFLRLFRRLRSTGQVGDIVVHTQDDLLGCGDLPDTYVLRMVGNPVPLGTFATIAGWAHFCLSLCQGGVPLVPGASPQIDLATLIAKEEPALLQAA